MSSFKTKTATKLWFPGKHGIFKILGFFLIKIEISKNNWYAVFFL